MPTPTYTPIASATLSSAQASVNFTGLSGYRDLIIVARNITSGTLAIRVNDNADTYYSWTRMTGTGSAANSSNSVNTTYWSPAYYCDPGNGFSFVLELLDYGVTSTYKLGLARSDNFGNGTERFSLKWNSLSAITSIKFFEAAGGNLNSGGVYQIYGVAA